MKNTLTWVLLIIVIAAAAVFSFTYMSGGNLAGESGASDYQAVFLVNGQVYFGQLANRGSSFMRLSDVYYLQVNQALQPAEEGATQTPDISLVKLGNELHGPMDEMLLNSEHVLLIEDLKQDSNVVRAITEYKQSAAEAPATTAPAN